MKNRLLLLLLLVCFFGCLSVYGQPTVSNKTLAFNRGSLTLSDLGTTCNATNGICNGCAYYWEEYDYGYSCDNSGSCNVSPSLGNTSDVNYGAILVNSSTLGTFTYNVVRRYREGDQEFCTVNESITETSSFTVSVINWGWNGTISDVCDNENYSIDLRTIFTNHNSTSFSGSGVSGNTWSSNGLSPGTYIITASRSFSNGTQTDQISVTINALPNVTFNTPPDFCQSDSNPNLDDWTNVNGTYSSSTATLGGTRNRNVILSSTPDGDHTITITYTDGNGCTNTESASIHIDAQNTVDAGANQESCQDEGDVTLTASTSGVSWSCVGCSYVSGNKFDTDAAPAGVYTVRASKTVGACSDTDDKTFTVKALPTVNAGNNVTICIDEGTLSLTGNSPSTGVWSGPGVGGNSMNLVTAGVGTHTVTFTHTDAQGCTNSDTRTVTVIGLPNENSINVTGDDRCGAGTVNLSASLSGHTIRWYASASGGSVLRTGNTYSPSVSVGTTSYYVSATNSNNCVSDGRKVVTAIAYAVPANPSSSDEERCGPGVLTFTASGSGAGATYRWYENSSGGSAVHVGASFLTPTLSSTRDYYVQATSSDGCPSNGRTKVTAIINSVPGAPTVFNGDRCGSGAVTLSAGGAPIGGSYRWYTAASGGTSFNSTNSISPSLTSTTSYYVSIMSAEGCEGPRGEVTATIFDSPSAPAVTNGSRCGPGTVTLSALGSNVDRYDWYSTAASSVSLASGASYSPSVSSTTSFWVEYTDNNGCTSPRSEVVATVNSIPPDPNPVHGSRCGPGSVEIGASGSGAGVTYSWYATPSGGSVLNTGSTYNTASITTTTTYYVSATTGAGCTSDNRIAVIATINSIPSEPVVFDGSNCGSGIVTLNVAGAPSGGSYRWYNNETGGSPFNTTSSYDADLVNSDSYWVSVVTAEGCEGPREEIHATIYNVPSAPSGVDGDRCGSGTVTLSATAGISGTMNWYETEASAVSLQAGSTYTTPSLSATKSYYVDITDANGCTSPRTEVVATVFAIPPDPSVSNTSSCGPGQVTLTASGSGAGAVYEWYQNSSGGSAVFTGETYEPTVSTTRDYYVQAISSDGCTSAARTQVTVTVNNIPSEPSTFDGSSCGAGNVTLTAGGTPSGGSYRWYTSSSGGTWFNSTNEYVASISSTTSYWVSAVSPEGCEGDRAEIVATINEIPNAPSGSDNDRCGPGSVMISASAPISGTFNWYATEVSATSLAVGSNFTTPSISATTSYWVDITNADGCVSPRTEVVATVYDIPSEPNVPNVERCGAGDVTISASGGEVGTIYSWYENSFGGSPIFTGPNFTTTVSTTRSYYVSSTSPDGCVSDNRTKVDVTINSVPGEPVVINGSNCGPGDVTLTVTGAPAGGSYRWYTSSSGGTSFNSSTSYTVNLSETTSYWVSAVSAEGCEGARAEIIGEIYDAPDAPTGFNGERCGTGSVSLSATATSDGTFDWYQTQASAVSLFTGVNFNTPTITETTSYWVAFTDGSGCVSARTEVIATVNEIPVEPTVPNVERCGSGQVTISASGSVSGATFNWYDNVSGGSSLFTGNDFTTNVTVSRSYYVSATSPEGCVSDNRTKVDVIVNALPSEPVVFDSETCGSGNVELTVGGTPAGGSYRWYTSPTGGSSFNSTNTYTANVTETTSYWVSAVSPQNCEGERAEVVATVNEIPQAPSGNGGVRCGTGSVSLSASATTSGSFNWYETQASAVSLFTGVNFNTPSISETTSYWVDFTNANGCTSPRTEVIATVNEIPTEPVVSDVERCSSGQVTISASGSVSGVTYNWYDNSSGGSSLFTGNEFTTNVTVSRSYYVSSTSPEGCVSANRTKVDVIVNSLPGEPVVFDASSCGAGDIELTVGGTPSGGSYRWYTASSGGSSFNSTNTYTANVSETTSYWVSAVSAEGCEGARAEVVATVYDAPAAPSGNNGVRCGTGSVSLSASATTSGSFNWYQTQASAVSLFTGVNFNTPSISETTSYWVDFTNANGCTSSRTEVIATVNFVIDDPVVENVSRCGSGLVSMTALSSDPDATFEWYENQFGGSPVFTGATYEVNLTLSDNFYVKAISGAGCESANRTPVTATINPLPSEPILSDASVCGSGSVELVAAGAPAGGTYNWYANAGSVSPIHTGSTFTTPSISSSEDYYVSIVNEFGCEGARERVDAIVNSFPNAPTVDDVERCGTGDVRLEATSSASTVNWYFNASGGSAFATGTRITIEDLDETTTYYAASLSSDGCESIRVPVRAIINPLVEATIGENLQLCLNSGTYDLTADLVDVSPSDGFFVGEGVVGTTFRPSIAGIGNKEITFVLTNDVGCLIDGSRIITVRDIVENGEELSFSVNEINACIQDGDINLNGLPNVSGGTWTIDNDGAINVGIIDPISSGVGEYTATYSVDINGCIVTASLPVNITATPDNPVVSGPALVCNGEEAELTASGGVAGTEYHWYISGESESFATGNTVKVTPDATTTYLVVAENSFGCLSDETRFDLELVDVTLDFSATPEKVSVGDRLEFTTDVSASEYLWDFGDELTSTAQNPSHIYFETGVFDVTLTVVTEEGCNLTLTKEDFIIVEDEDRTTVLGVGDDLESEISSVYPSPFVRSFKVEFHSPSAQSARVSLFNINGLEVKAKRLNLIPGENIIEFTGLTVPDGIYFLRVLDENNQVYDMRVMKKSR